MEQVNAGPLRQNGVLTQTRKPDIFSKEAQFSCRLEIPVSILQNTYTRAKALNFCGSL
jgi:hypothetical protein